MKSDAQLIEDARRDKIPSLNFARRIDAARRDYLKCINEEERASKIKALEEVLKQARSVHRFKWLIRVANAAFGFVALAAYAVTLTYGYRQFVAPAFDLPVVSVFDLFMTVFLVKYSWKGINSAAAVEKREEELNQEKARLWLDNVKREARASAYNIGGAGMVALFFYLFTLIV